MLFKSENAVFKFSGVEWREPKTRAKNRNVHNPSYTESRLTQKRTRTDTIIAQDMNIKQFTKTTKATATRTALNKRFNEQRNRCARALYIFDGTFFCRLLQDYNVK